MATCYQRKKEPFQTDSAVLLSEIGRKKGKKGTLMPQRQRYLVNICSKKSTAKRTQRHLYTKIQN